MLLRRWQENDKNAEKWTQDLAGASSLFFVLNVDPCASPLLLAFRACLCLRAKYKKRSIWGGDSSLPIPFLPHLFWRQIRRLKVRNMTRNHILIIRYPLSKLNAGPKIDSRRTPQVTVWGIEMLFSTIHCCYPSDKLWFNPFTGKVHDGVL